MVKAYSIRCEMRRFKSKSRNEYGFCCVVYAYLCDNGFSIQSAFDITVLLASTRFGRTMI